MKINPKKQDYYEKTHHTGVLLAVLFSCQTENKVIVSQEQLQTQEMKDFNEAFRNLGKPQNKATEQERKSGSIELSDRRPSI